MFLVVFCKSSASSPLLLYDKEGKPAGRKINSSKPLAILRKLTRNLQKKRSAGCIV